MNIPTIFEKVKVDVVFTNNFDLYLYGPIIKNSICAVIDTLAATSTIVSILNSKCYRIILARETDEAFELKKILKNYLLCGEENGIPPKGFDYPNLPSKFLELNLKNKKIIFKTTNGTVSFFKLLISDYIFAVSLLNLKYAIKIILELAIEKEKNIFLVCSGRMGTIAYEDVYTAGLAIKYLIESNDLILTDAARVALDSSNNGREVFNVLENSQTGALCKELGYYNDLEFCARLNIFNILPRLKVLNLDSNLKCENMKSHKNLYNTFIKTKEIHNFSKLLLLEPF